MGPRRGGGGRRNKDAVLLRMSIPYHIRLRVETADPEAPRKEIFSSASITEILGEYFVAEAIELFQGQEGATHRNGMAGINAILLFHATGLRFQGWDGIGHPHKSKRKNTTINTYAGVALDLKCWDRILGGVWRVSRPLFH